MLLRAILILPNAFVLLIFQLFAFVVVVIMWFAALFTGRVTKGMWTFVAEVLRWSGRAYAYGYLLTDKYPPFNGNEAPYPVAIAISGPPARFNRWAVLFRIILLLPAYLVSTAFSSGLVVVSVVAWICAVILGRVPRALHLVLAAGLRYQLRFYAYAELITPVYPWGVLGDRSETPDRSLLAGSLVLRGAARVLAIAALVVGAAYVVGGNTYDVVVVRARVQRVVAQVQVDDMAARAEAAGGHFDRVFDKCKDLTCAQAAVQIQYDNLATQVSTLRSISYPTAGSGHAADRLVALLRTEEAVLGSMEVAHSLTQFLAEEKKLVKVERRVQPVAVNLHDHLFQTFPTD